jgi:hypothetical protein
MIPDLGLMIWAYIMFRMIEIFAFPASRYVSKVAVCVLRGPDHAFRVGNGAFSSDDKHPKIIIDIL